MVQKWQKEDCVEVQQPIDKRNQELQEIRDLGKATEEGEQKMYLEKRLEIQRNETINALQILMGYAEKLVARNLEKNRDSIE